MGPAVASLRSVVGLVDWPAVSLRPAIEITSS
jgi:hypothetical protein